MALLLAGRQDALAGDDGGHILGGHTVQVQVNLGGPLDRGPRCWERFCGPPGDGEYPVHHERRARPPPAHPARHEGGPGGEHHAEDDGHGDDDQAGQLGAGGEDRASDRGVSEPYVPSSAQADTRLLASLSATLALCQ